MVKGRGNGENATSARRLEAEERQRRAWEMRVAGASLLDIARELGYAGRQGSLVAIEAWREKVRLASSADVAAERDVQMARLERLLLDLWSARVKSRIEVPRADGTKEIKLELDLAVFDRINRILIRQAKLLGLDAAELREDERLRIEGLQAELLATVFDRALERLGLPEDTRLLGRGAIAAELRVLEGDAVVVRDVP